jgi:hypothetical protein
MLKALKVLSMAMVAAMAVAPRAQASDALKANVPFDFVVAGQAMPSGEYQFVRSEDPRVVQVYSRERGRVVITAYTAAPAAMPEAGLVFHKIGEQRFLKSISIGRTTIALPTTRAERLAAAAQGAGRTVASTLQ